MKRVAIVTTFADFGSDYSLTGVVSDQLRMLTAHGYPTTLVVQENFQGFEALPEGVQVRPVMPVLPLHDYQLGEVPRPDFDDQAARVEAALRPVVGACDVAITHDLMFLGWYLPHNEAIRRLAKTTSAVRWLHWVHSAPLPRPPRLTYPHGLRYSLPPRSKLVFLNHCDALRLAEMFAASLHDVRIVYNSKDPATFFAWHPLTERIARDYPLLSADVVSVYPFSTPRWEAKNVPRLFSLMAAVKAQGRDVLLVCVNAHGSGADEKRTVRRLRRRAVTEGLAEKDICFTSEFGAEWAHSVPHEAVRQLFQLANVFVHPSQAEACPLILLEAALCKNLLVLNADVPVMREFGGGDALYPQFGSVWTRVAYDDEKAYWRDWARIILATLDRERSLGSFRRILRRHDPRRIFRRQLEPLFYESWE